MTSSHVSFEECAEFVDDCSTSAQQKRRRKCNQDACELCSIRSLFIPNAEGITPIEEILGIDLSKHVLDWYYIVDEKVVGYNKSVQLFEYLSMI